MAPALFVTDVQLLGLEEERHMTVLRKLGVATGAAAGSSALPSYEQHAPSRRLSATAGDGHSFYLCVPVIGDKSPAWVPVPARVTRTGVALNAPGHGGIARYNQ